MRGVSSSCMSDLPRAGVLCENALGETLYLTSLSPQALQRRAEKAYAI